MHHVLWVITLCLFRCIVAVRGDMPMPLEEPQSGWAFGGWSWSQANLDVVDHEPVESFLSRPASFGPHVVDEPGLPGYLIPVSSFSSTCFSPSDLVQDPDWYHKNNTGCPPLCIDPAKPKPEVVPLMRENWIALVQRGDCQFLSKVRAAQGLGAKAVVVGGWKVVDGDRDDLVNMFSADNSTDIKIPSTYVSYASYHRLMKLIASSNTTTSGLRTISVVLRAEDSWGWFSPILTFLLFLLLPSLLTFMTLLYHRFRQSRQERLDRAPESVVSRLPARIWTGSGWEKEGDWLKKMKIRGQRAQVEEQIRIAKDHETGINPRLSVTIDERILPDDGVAVTSPNDLEAGVLAINIPSTTLGDDHQETSSTRAPSSDSDDLPETRQPWFQGQSECAICLSQYVEGDRVRILPCGHLFHVDEVDPWLVQRKKLCPICKSDVTMPYTSPSTSTTPLPLLSSGLDHPQDTPPNAPPSSISARLARQLPRSLRLPFISRRHTEAVDEHTPLLRDRP